MTGNRVPYATRWFRAGIFGVGFAVMIASAEAGAREAEDAVARGLR